VWYCVLHILGWRGTQHFWQNHFIWVTDLFFVHASCNFHWNHCLKKLNLYQNSQHYFANSCHLKLQFLVVQCNTSPLIILTVAKSFEKPQGMSKQIISKEHHTCFSSHSLPLMTWKLHGQTTFLSQLVPMQPWLVMVAWTWLWSDTDLNMALKLSYFRCLEFL
jgi:hypothetical protein